MPLTQSEFNVIQNVIKHVVDARRIALSNNLDISTNHTMARIFDPGTGLRYILLDTVEQTDRNSLFFKQNLLQHGIEVGGVPGTEVQKISDIKQSQVSKYYELFILPKSVKDNLDTFYKDFYDSDIDVDSDLDSDTDTDLDPSHESIILKPYQKIVKEFKSRVLRPVYNELVEFYQYEITNKNPLYVSVNSSEMARYTLIGLLMNAVSLHPDIDDLRPLLNKAISSFLSSKLKDDVRSKHQVPETKAFVSPALTIRKQTPLSSLSLAITTSPLILDYTKILNDLEKSYIESVKLYIESRKKRFISFLRDSLGIKKSHITQWFFGLKREFSLVQNPEIKIEKILESYSKLSRNEKIIIQSEKKYQSIFKICLKLKDIEDQISQSDSIRPVKVALA